MQRSIVGQVLSLPFKFLKAVVVAYIEQTIRENETKSTKRWVHNISSEATQGKASTGADKKIEKHWAKDFLLRVQW